MSIKDFVMGAVPGSKLSPGRRSAWRRWSAASFGLTADSRLQLLYNTLAEHALPSALIYGYFRSPAVMKM